MLVMAFSIFSRVSVVSRSTSAAVRPFVWIGSSTVLNVSVLAFFSVNNLNLAAHP
jgi:hypothetical protein